MAGVALSALLRGSARGVAELSAIHGFPASPATPASRWSDPRISSELRHTLCRALQECRKCHACHTLGAVRTAIAKEYGNHFCAGPFRSAERAKSIRIPWEAGTDSQRVRQPSAKAPQECRKCHSCQTLGAFPLRSAESATPATPWEPWTCIAREYGNHLCAAPQEGRKCNQPATPWEAGPV